MSTKPRGGGPAFPSPQFAVPQELREEQVMLLRSLSGMSLRQYYKAHAPVDIPGWFAHVEPSKTDIPDMPDCKTIIGPDKHVLRDAALSWVNDPCWDLRDTYPVLAWFQDQAEACWMAQQEWERRDLYERAKQWAAFWADMMLAEDVEHAQRED